MSVMPANESISRELFLQQFAMAGAGFLLSSVNSLAFANQQRRIKIAVIGCGSVSGQYLPHFSKSSYVELVSCCDIVYERAKKSRENKIPNNYPHIDKSWRAPHSICW